MKEKIIRSITVFLRFQLVIYFVTTIFLVFILRIFIIDIHNYKKIENSLFDNNLEYCKYKVEKTVEYINKSLEDSVDIETIKKNLKIINYSIIEIEYSEEDSLGKPSYNPIFIDDAITGEQIFHIDTTQEGKISYYDVKDTVVADSLLKKLLLLYKPFLSNCDSIGKITYSYDYDTTSELFREKWSKTAYVQAIDTLNWIVGCGVLKDEINKKKENYKSSRYTLFILFGLISIIIIISLVLTRRYVRNFKQDITNYKDFFKDLNFTDTEIDVMPDNKVYFTEHKELTNEINKMITRYNQIQKYFETDNVVIIIDEFNVIKFVNKKYEENFEEKSSAIGKSLIEISDYWNIKQKLDKVRIDKKQDSYIVKYKNKWWKTTLYPIISENNQVNDIVLQDTDITELKKTQDQLFESKKLEQLGYVVRGISHEISTPIATCKLGIDSISYDIENYLKKLKTQSANIKITEFLFDLENRHKRIYRNLVFAGDLLESYHNIAKDELKGEKRFFNIEDKVGDIIVSIQPRIEHINTEIDIKTNFIGKKMDVYNYPNAISQILLNLLINTIKHGFKNQEKGIISIDIEIDEKNILINYSDNGVGIPEKEIPVIFDIFYTTNPSDSSGLGLSIIKRIIEDINGEIRYIKNQEQGVNFRIILPLINY